MKLSETTITLDGAQRVGPETLRDYVVLDEHTNSAGLTIRRIGKRSTVVDNARKRLLLARGPDALVDSFATLAASSADNPLTRSAERRRNKAAMQTVSGANTGVKRVQNATREYVRWIVDAREKLQRWDRRPDATNPPVTKENARQRQREAVKAGADPHVVQAVELDEPESLVALDAERRLMQSVLGKVL